MNAPTPEQIAKLPKWAQEHLADLDRRVVVAERMLNEYLDNQTPSEFFVDDYIGSGDIKYAKHFIQTHKMSVVRDGVRLDILLRHDQPGIDLSWGDEGRVCREVAFVPTAFQQARLVSKEKMRA